MNDARQVRKERTHWRDERLSERHRTWGWDCPVTGIDFLLLEYNNSAPSALVEYKHERATPQYVTNSSIKALSALGTQAEIPFFVCRYADDFSWWKAVPLNVFACVFVPVERRGQSKEMTEDEWVTLLYEIRGRKRTT